MIRFWGTSEERDQIREIIMDNKPINITYYTIGELKRTLLDALVNCHNIINKWIQEHPFKKIKSDINDLLSDLDDLSKAIYLGSFRRTNRVKRVMDYLINIQIRKIINNEIKELANRSISIDPRKKMLFQLKPMIEDFEDEFIDIYFFRKVASKIECGWRNYDFEKKGAYYKRVGYSCRNYDCRNKIVDWFNSLKEIIQNLVSYLTDVSKSKRPNWFRHLKILMNYCLSKDTEISSRILERICRYIGDAILILDVGGDQDNKIITSNIKDFSHATDFLNIDLITYRRTSYTGKLP